MASPQTIRLNVALVDPQLDLEERNKQALRLISELKALDTIKNVSPGACDRVPPMSKSPASYIAGLLTAEVNLSNAKSVLRFLGSRLRDKPVELEVAAGDRRLKVKARSVEELEQAIAAAQNFISS